MQKNLACPSDNEALRRHVFATYSSLRVGMVVVAVLFPVILYVAGKLEGVTLQGSMSAYYWASLGAGQNPPARVWFIGGLFAIGACLYLYKGFSMAENIALNFAAVFAIGVAYFPTEWNCGPGNVPILQSVVPYCVDGWNPHGFFAVMLFVCLAYVTFFRSADTLPELKDEKLRARYLRWYRITTAAMLAAPLSAVALHVIFIKYDAITYFLELSGIWTFAFYWFIKTLEMRHSQAEEKALQGRDLDLERKPPSKLAEGSLAGGRKGLADRP